MVGFTYNEVSRRYVDDAPEFFTPDVWRARPEGSVKQGSGGALDMEGYGDTQAYISEMYDDFLDYAKGIYEDFISYGIAPELARMVLPQSMYTSYYVTGSLYAWARAYNLRIDPHAQKEIQDLAKMWGEIAYSLFPVSWEALTI